MTVLNSVPHASYFFFSSIFIFGMLRFRKSVAFLVPLQVLWRSDSNKLIIIKITKNRCHSVQMQAVLPENTPDMHCSFFLQSSSCAWKAITKQFIIYYIYIYIMFMFNIFD